MNPKDNITIIQHNTLHWESNKVNLMNTYQQINADIILLNSHGLKNTNQLYIKGYQTYLKNSSNQLSDGSAILVRKNIKHKYIDNFMTDFLEIQLETSLGTISIATTYLPPRRPYLPFPDIHSLMYNIHPTYLLGDLNAKHRLLGNNTNNTVGKGIARFIQNNKAIHLGPNFPTFFSHNATSSPDIVLSNNKAVHNVTIDPGPITTSDHIPIIVTLTTQALIIPTTPIINLGKANWNIIREDIRHNMNLIQLDGHITTQDIDEKLEKWYNIIESSIKENTPKTTTQMLSKPISSPSLKHLQHCFKLIHSQATIYGWTRALYHNLKYIQNKIREESTKIKDEHNTQKINKLVQTYTQPQKFWELIKKMKSSQTPQNHYILKDNNKLTADSEKELAFREIWEKVFQILPEENILYDNENQNFVEEQLRNNVDLIQPYNLSDLSRLQGRYDMDTLVTMSELENSIKKLKNDTPGISLINRTVLKKLPEIALTKLQWMFNHTISLGYFPNKFKTASIKLIPKPNTDQSNPINYRPISLLEVTGKLLERIINTRITIHLETKNIIKDTQHGFRNFRGTDTALTVIHETIAHHTANKQQCYLILRDVSKAFDKVWQDGLKYKIIQLQLPTPFTKLLNTFLVNREAKIKIGTFTGPPIPLLAGVPQGSILSPTLYTIYTNDIPPPAIDCTNIQYADDITQIISYPGKSRAFMANRVKKEIEKINNFEMKWKIKTNNSKFKIIPIAVKKKDNIVINGNPINYTDNGKVLGLTISRTGIAIHINNIKNRANIAINELRIFKNLPTNIKTHLVKAYILPILRYPIIPLITASKENLKKLQTVQNTAIRFACNERFPYTKNTQTLHEDTDIEPLNSYLYKQVTKLYNKMSTPHFEYFSTILDNYEGHKDHNWFKKIKNILDRGEPVKKYTYH